MIQPDHSVPPASPTTAESQCLISFGSNLGDRDQRVAAAARIIAASPVVENFSASRLFQTPPIGGPGGQEPFLNAVAAFDTSASARDILAMLQHTEDQLGRVRHQRWSARSIDLDVVLHGELIGGGTGLVVPHPRYTARQFVLEPARDVASRYRDPRFGWTLDRLGRHVAGGVASLALVGDDEATRKRLCQRLRDEHGIQTFVNCPTEPTSSDAVDAVPADQSQPWVSNFVPASLDHVCQKLASGQDASDELDAPSIPRLIARMQRVSSDSRWPAPHQMWPSRWRYPEYRLEVDDLDWAVAELVSALQSMRCPVHPVTTDGTWYL